MSPNTKEESRRVVIVFDMTQQVGEGVIVACFETKELANFYIQQHHKASDQKFLLRKHLITRTFIVFNDLKSQPVKKQPTSHVSS